MKPEIRIVHIVAPAIIETDPENFRETVQRLTGKHEKSGTVDRKRAPESASLEVRSIDEYLIQPASKKVKIEEEKEPELGCVDNAPPAYDYGVVDAIFEEICQMPSILLGSLYGDILSEELICL